MLSSKSILPTNYLARRTRKGVMEVKGDLYGLHLIHYFRCQPYILNHATSRLFAHFIKVNMVLAMLADSIRVN